MWNSKKENNNNNSNNNALPHTNPVPAMDPYVAQFICMLHYLFLLLIVIINELQRL